MKAFHPQSHGLYDTYIKRYEYNHLQTCFNQPKNETGIFVACAVDESNNEEIVGFCSVDGRPNDPSSRVEFLTPSTLASTCPRPYLSDLGVLPLHRRKGLAQTLVGACEEWALQRGCDTLYLKVDETNKGPMTLYKGLGYVRTILPWMRPGSGAKKWDNDILLEKKLCRTTTTEVTKTSSRFRRLWRKISMQR